jgi:ribonuclease HI
MHDNPSARLWLAEMTESLSADDFARVAVTLWAIWYARRKMIHEEVFQSPLSTHLFVENYLRDLVVLKPAERRAAAPKTAHPRWLPPDRGCVKINVDAALRKSSPGGAVGAMCRNAEGSFIGASSLTINGITDPEVLEALACREALALAQDLVVDRVTVSSDCLSVVNNLKNKYAGNYSLIIDEVKATARSMSVVQFRHENRASNTEAHRLARSVVSFSSGRRVWFVQPPEGLCIVSSILNE